MRLFGGGAQRAARESVVEFGGPVDPVSGGNRQSDRSLFRATDTWTRKLRFSKGDLMKERYSKDHVWIREEGAVCRVGLTAFAQKELGEIVFVELPQVGRHVHQGDAVCSIDSLKSTSDIYAPASGTIVATNPRAAQENAAAVNKDPLGEGWLFSMSIDDPSQLGALLTEDEYAAFVR